MGLQNENVSVSQGIKRMCYIIKSVVGVALFVGIFYIIYLVVYEIQYWDLSPFF